MLGLKQNYFSFQIHHDFEKANIDEAKVFVCVGGGGVGGGGCLPIFSSPAIFQKAVKR